MTIQYGKNIAVAMLAGAAFCTSALLLGADDPEQFSPWSTAVNAGSPPNSSATEQGVSISKDGLSLYFISDRPGGYGGLDIYVSHRLSVNDAWGEAMNLGPRINTPYNEFSPRPSIDGHRLYFTSDRPDIGFGGQDNFVSRRYNKRDDLGWQEPENLGSNVNSAANDAGPEIFEDEITGITTLYFSSNRPGPCPPIGDCGDDIYASILQPDETFGPATRVTELSTPFADRQPAIRRDGLEMFIASTRPGGSGGVDLWSSTRATTSDPWSAPVNLGSAVNTSSTDARPALSFDGTTLYFQSNRPGGLGALDLYVTKRTNLQGTAKKDEQ
jgi:WD40-like Beta Propeller Repeat